MKTLRFSLAQIIPVLFPYMFVGLAYGILLQKAGYSALWAFFSSLLIYAGSMQIVMVGLLASGTPLPMIAGLTFFVNARHIFYGIGFLEEFRSIGKRCFWKYPYMALTVTDETCCLLNTLDCPDGIDRETVQFEILLFCHLFWVVCSTAGALAGGLISLDMTGIDFSAAAFFITASVRAWSEPETRLPAAVGLAAACLAFLLLGRDTFILPALTVSAAVLLALRPGKKPKEGGNLSHE